MKYKEKNLTWVVSNPERKLKLTQAQSIQLKDSPLTALSHEWCGYLELISQMLPIVAETENSLSELTSFLIIESMVHFIPFKLE